MTASAHLRRYLLCCALALAAAQAPAAAPAGRAATRTPVSTPIRAIEQALEVSMAQLRLPDGETGFMLVESCATCPTRSLAVDARSQFFLDGRPIALELLRRRLTARGTRVATALYAPADMRLTRLLVTSR